MKCQPRGRKQNPFPASSENKSAGACAPVIHACGDALELYYRGNPHCFVNVSTRGIEDDYADRMISQNRLPDRVPESVGNRMCQPGGLTKSTA